MKKDRIIKSSHYGHRPWWFRALNRAWRSAGKAGFKPDLSKDSLIRAARKSTGLSDLGKDFMDEPLDRLLWSIREEARLHPVGAFITRQRMINLLAARLRAEEIFRKNPGILDRPLLPAWVILGLQRTGTTKLHRLLAADESNRVLLSWEAINPVPLDIRNAKPETRNLEPETRNLEPETRNPKQDKRIAIAKTSENALRLMAPGFFAIHPVEHNAPEEDILLLDITFMSTTPEATMNVPSYAAWLETTDQSAAYEYMVKLLKLLQWQRPGIRWILKSPHHLEFINLIDKHFDDVHFFWTHREVTECIPSFISMAAHSRVIFSDEAADGNTIARHWIRKTGYMLRKGLEYRTNNQHKNQFTDIFYDGLVGNSAGILTGIYSLDGGMTPELLEKFSRAEKNNPMRKYGIHEYRLEDFGVRKEDILKETADYRNFIKNHIRDISR
ncbi:MAG: sulfotransferase [Bacteroidales bacterium]|nr:sulfotransferase [Bacteroidales bacterium]